MHEKQPIGVIDSGVGGLTVLRRLRETLPREDFIYLGDTARTPYGTRDKETICRFVGEITDWMEGQAIKQLVVACNTITVLGEAQIRGGHPFPVIGMDRGAELALRAAGHKRIGVFATDFTVRSGVHKRDIQRLDPAAEVFAVGCTKFVPLIENEQFDTPELAAAIREYAGRLQAHHVEAVILGCTHYPFVAEQLARAFGPSVTIVDPAEATAQRAKADLEARGLLRAEGTGRCTICFTGDVERGARLAARMLDPSACQFIRAELLSIPTQSRKLKVGNSC